MLDEFEGANIYIHQVVFHLTGDCLLLPNQYWFLPGSTTTDCLMDLLGENKEDLQMMFLYDLYSNQVSYDYSLHDLYSITTGMAQVCL